MNNPDQPSPERRTSLRDGMRRLRKAMTPIEGRPSVATIITQAETPDALLLVLSTLWHYQPSGKTLDAWKCAAWKKIDGWLRKSSTLHELMVLREKIAASNVVNFCGKNWDETISWRVPELMIAAKTGEDVAFIHNVCFTWPEIRATSEQLGNLCRILCSKHAPAGRHQPRNP